MPNLLPFEIRLDLLKIAQGMLSDDYYGKREQISNDWQMQCEAAKIKGETPPSHPGFPPYPSEIEIIAKAQVLNGFVSNVFPPETPKVTVKKSS